MNQLFLLKLILDLIRQNTEASLSTAQKILEKMIEENQAPEVTTAYIPPLSDLDEEARKAQQELMQ